MKGLSRGIRADRIPQPGASPRAGWLIFELFPELLLSSLALAAAVLVLASLRAEPTSSAASSGAPPSRRSDSEFSLIVSTGLPLYGLARIDDDAFVWCSIDRKLVMTMTESGRTICSETIDSSVLRVVSAESSGRMVVGRLDGAVAVRDRQDESWRLLGQHRGLVAALACDAMGELVASAGHDRTIRLWSADDVAPSTTIDIAPAQCRALAVSPDGRWVAAAVGAEIHLIEGKTPRRRRVLADDPSLASIAALAMSRDGRCLAATRDDGVVELWKLETTAMAWRITSRHGITHAVAVAHDGSMVLLGTMHGTLCGVDIATGDELFSKEAHRGMIRGVLPLTDGSAITYGYDGLVQRWDPSATRTAGHIE